MMLVAAALVVLAAAVLSIPARSLARSPAATWRGRWHRARSVLGRRSPEPAVGRVLVEVAARLRVGTDLVTAWERALPDPAPVWAPRLMDALGLTPVRPGHGARAGPAAARRRARWTDRRARRDGPDIAAALAACRLTRRSGAPLAEVIGVVVGGIDEAREADELRRTALAGPRATATLLAWLPLGGLGLGVLLGADPLGVLLGGGLGGLSLVLGGALFVAGRQWVRVLILQAERAGA